ncbi:hypothetical protein SELMODRAFT_414320 [Selaginella moellendorffii]|uniref:RING-type E3 ubiquitin transferase n=1 Tax=Selaginella moellendorffii TaxID=88036 RepID=D8RSD0_SELML|nr:U-box domain-containing protein 39 [Selaginella moellendorffii]EFJ24844.1 hypothetical protein SELMODRAFT_414320 [Selaginella moellendorffii]|eukprot:XP_002973889.1 U-box domain-containing protein 39 [Selaginella moellendorffii]
MGTAALEPPLGHHQQQQQQQSLVRPQSLQIPGAASKILVPEEFRCPISGEAMADPVIVASGQSYERACIQEWLAQGRSDCFKTKAKLEHTFLIPNVALKAAILNWSAVSGISSPEVVSSSRATDLVARKIVEERNAAVAAAVAADGDGDGDGGGGQGHDRVAVSSARYVHSATGASLRTDMVECGRSSVPHPLDTNPRSLEEDERSCATMDPRLVPDLVRRLSSSSSRGSKDQMLAASQVRQLAREGTFNRRTLCQADLLEALVALLQSPHKPLVIHSLAAILNLSLEVDNKLMIVRAGATPHLVHALRSNQAEIQEHAAGAIFSLALHEDNRLAIGVLGAIPPLIEILRPKRPRQQQPPSPRAQQDASMALYHLSLAQLNRGKMVKAGLVPILLSIAEEQGGGARHREEQGAGIQSSHDLASRCMCILSCLAASSDGRTALLEINGVRRLFALLRNERRNSPPSQGGDGDHDERELKEHVVAVLVHLSNHNIRFKPLAAEARGVEALVALVDSGAATSRAKEKIVTLLSILKDPPSGVNSPSFTSLGEPFFPRSYGGRRHGLGGGKAESSHF